jgi:alpha-L-arabinofuranosidase
MVCDAPENLKMEELVTKHSAIMDKYDPNRSVSLVVDEWGAWYTVEPGTNPGFLYQQNTLRDALIAGINLNIFNNHCSRVRMAAVAQVANDPYTYLPCFRYVQSSPGRINGSRRTDIRKLQL